MADLTGADGCLRELALFAGAGGGILGGHLLGWRTICAVEWEPFPASVLCARQNDGILPAFPIWDDVQTFDGKPWRGIVDVISGGFPCQDISAAGKGGGIEGSRSGLWSHMARIIGEVLPRFVFVENSPLLVGRGLAVVIGDLAALGYDAQWGCVSASNVGAPHQRDRIWIVAYPMQDRWDDRMVGNSDDKPRENRVTSIGLQDRLSNKLRSANIPVCDDGWPIPPEARGVAEWVASGVESIAAIGNGQVPRVAAAAFTLLSGE